MSSTINKPKVAGYFLDGTGFSRCQRCQKRINGAGKTGRIKNRNYTRFWGLKIEFGILCGDCLVQYRQLMPPRKKYTFKDYQKREYWNWN